MTTFKMTKHAVDRLAQEFGMTPRVSLIIDELHKKKIHEQEGNLYIKMFNGVFAAQKRGDVYVLTTFIGKSRLSESGKAQRAYKYAA